jgi:hypothetical protein
LSSISGSLTLSASRRPLVSSLLRSRTFWVCVGIFALGAILRLVFGADMEFKSDEQWMFDRAVRTGITEPWPLLGMPSGVYVRNPGMSVWVFVLLARLFHVVTPVELGRAVQLLNTAALGVLLFFATRLVRNAREREIWLWAIALGAVNPFAILYQRKIWAQSVLPLFSACFLVAWWKRGTRSGAFFWGLIGACLGQIHMAGFFFAAGFALWGALWDRKGVRWRYWFLGSVLGAIPLLPWLAHFADSARHGGHSIFFGWNEASQLKFWVFWITDSLGLHLGNSLGVKISNSGLRQLADFLRYPLVGGHATYGVAAVHLGLLALAVLILGPALRRPRSLTGILRGDGGPTALTRTAALWGYGLLITAATIVVHRYYLIITFPLEFLWLAHLALRGGFWSERRGRDLLALSFVLQLLLSASFLGYIHVNGGAPLGDYGVAYSAQGR